MNRILKNLFVNSGVEILLRKINKTPRIIFWHGVDYVKNPFVEQEICDVHLFEWQLEFLCQNYEIISLSELENRFLKKKFTNREIVLTFDDGYANNLYVVEPIMKKFSLPFTVFISTEHVTTGEYFPTSVNRIILNDPYLQTINIPSQNVCFRISNSEERNRTLHVVSNMLKTLPLMQVKSIVEDLINNVGLDRWKELKDKYKSVCPMTWEEVKEISRRGVEIGSHCMWHICCHSNQNKEDIKTQIVESKRIIENKIGKECRYFAYPNGNYTDFSNSIVNANYAMGFSTNKKEKFSSCSNTAQLPRIGIPSNIALFKILLSLYPSMIKYTNM